MAGFVLAVVGIALMVVLIRAWDNVAGSCPGCSSSVSAPALMLTPSVNVVQSSFPEEQQGEISGLSRSVSNLGSSFGTAIAGTILVANLASGNRSYSLAMGVLAVIRADRPRCGPAPSGQGRADER